MGVADGFFFGLGLIFAAIFCGLCFLLFVALFGR